MRICLQSHKHSDSGKHTTLLTPQTNGRITSFIPSLVSSLHNQKHPAVGSTWALNVCLAAAGRCEWRRLAGHCSKLVISSILTGMSGDNGNVSLFSANCPRPELLCSVMLSRHTAGSTDSSALTGPRFIPSLAVLLEAFSLGVPGFDVVCGVQPCQTYTTRGRM